jgi:hypothetical protein
MNGPRGSIWRKCHRLDADRTPAPSHTNPCSTNTHRRSTVFSEDEIRYRRNTMIPRPSKPVVSSRPLVGSGMAAGGSLQVPGELKL